MKENFTRAAKRLFLKSGVYNLIRYVFPNPHLAILRYHAVVSLENNYYSSPQIAIDPAEFEQHVRYFKQHYKILTLDDLVDLALQRVPYPSNGVVFTFDDGYADNFQAAQILSKYNAAGTFYVTAEPVMRKSLFWLAELIVLILKTDRRELTVSLNTRSEKFELSDYSTRWQLIRKLERAVKSNDLSFRERIRNEIRKQLADDTRLKMIENLMLDIGQVQKMLNMGMIIGSHTLSHLNLPNANESDAMKEIASSKQTLEAALRTSIRHFSYPNSGPYAYFNEKIKAMVQSAGYQSASTSRNGFVKPNSDLFALQRIRTVPDLAEVIHDLEWVRLFQSSEM